MEFCRSDLLGRAELRCPRVSLRKCEDKQQLCLICARLVLCWGLTRSNRNVGQFNQALEVYFYFFKIVFFPCLLTGFHGFPCEMHADSFLITVFCNVLVLKFICQFECIHVCVSAYTYIQFSIILPL